MTDGGLCQGKWFPARHDASVIHRGRKQFPSSFLSGPAPLLCTTAGNFSPMVSCPAWHRCYAPRQETFHQWFPVRPGTAAMHRGRKLFTNGFLPGLSLLLFTTTRNFSQRVSHRTHGFYHPPQEIYSSQ
jgi:hypothetical protein